MHGKCSGGQRHGVFWTTDNDPYNLIMTDLVALIGHVQASLRLIEARSRARRCWPSKTPPPMSSFSTTSARDTSARPQP
jgi:hypothetical protein